MMSDLKIVCFEWINLTVSNKITLCQKNNVTIEEHHYQV